ncbi:hypothetical protein ES705_38241 [subsurface metagenome]
MSVAEIKKMTPLERIQTMELLWDVMSHEEEEIVSPNWHEEILNERKNNINSGKTNFISLNQLKNKFNNSK